MDMPPSNISPMSPQAPLPMQSGSPAIRAGTLRALRIAAIIAVGVLVIGGGVIFLVLRRPPASPSGGQAATTPTIEEIPRPATDPIPDDSDRDGLTNAEEAAAGTNPKEFDTDFDGISDLDEVRVTKTDPKNPDTDGDGHGDGLEIVGGFNPNGPGTRAP